MKDFAGKIQEEVGFELKNVVKAENVTKEEMTQHYKRIKKALNDNIQGKYEIEGCSEDNKTGKVTITLLKADKGEYLWKNEAE